MEASYTIYQEGSFPKKKRDFIRDGSGSIARFPNRRSARNWCINHGYLDSLYIVHPNGKEELVPKDYVSEEATR